MPVVETRLHRLARNESAFRQINEQIDQRVDGWEELGHTVLPVVCECADPSCVEQIKVTPAEYRSVRRHPDRFLIARGHDTAEIETVVYRHDRYWIVAKDPGLL